MSSATSAAASTQAVATSTEHARFVFTPSSVGYGYHLEVAGAHGWRQVTASGNALVSGPAFDLRPDEVLADERGLTLSGVTRARGEAPLRWHGTVSPSPDGWFRIDLELDSDGFPIGERDAVEPQLLLDLGPLPPYERGDHVWFKTLVQNPTQWNGEGHGNDFPALAYVDPYLHARFRMFFDMTPMSWMGPDTIARFQSYACGLRRRYDGRPAAEIGLIADAQSGHSFPAGIQRFSWCLHVAEYLGDPPAEQDELRALVDDCLHLLPAESGRWPEGATSWAEFAAGCADDLMSTEHSWGRDELGEYLLAYVDGRSDAWSTTMAARGREHNGDGPCLEAALWTLRPLDALAAALPATRFAGLHARLEAFVRAELGRPRCALLSGRRTESLPMGTWQYMYMLAETWFLFADRDATLRRSILQEITDIAIPLARATGHLFPLQFDKSTLRKFGPGSAYAVAGTYALLMIDLAEREHDDSYLAEAKEALRALMNVPIDDALQEVVLIAHALDAADRLAASTGDDEWERAREYFRAQTLRMMYWYDDRTSPRNAQSSQLGMFLACANIGYPAFFENIETDARLAAVVHAETDPRQSLKVLNYGRRTNFSFFPRCSPQMFGPMPLDFIPFEEVPILEGPNDAGFLGQEIYGAGFVLRAHLLWDAYAYAIDREVMVVSLDSYRERPGASWSGSFAIWASGGGAVQTDIVFPVLEGAGGDVTITAPGAEPISHRVAGGGTLTVSLPAGGWLRMTVERDRIAA